MADTLFKRHETALGPIPAHTYCVFYPGDTFATSLIAIRPTDEITQVTGFVPPADARYYSDGSASWVE